MATEFVSSAPTSNGENCPIYFAEMHDVSSRLYEPSSESNSIVEFWHQVCQPLIDNPTKYGFDEHDKPRADAGWNWKSYLQTYVWLGAQLGQEPRAYAVVYETGEGYFPAAMLLLARNYRDLNTPKQKASFGWFMSVAPNCVYEYHENHGNYGITTKNAPKNLGKILVDSLMVASNIRGHKGRIGLHADPAGKEELTSFYEGIPLQRLDSEIKISLARGNDGNYFFSDEKNSLALTTQFDHFRPKVPKA